MFSLHRIVIACASVKIENCHVIIENRYIISGKISENFLNTKEPKKKAAPNVFYQISSFHQMIDIDVYMIIHDCTWLYMMCDVICGSV